MMGKKKVRAGILTLATASLAGAPMSQAPAQQHVVDPEVVVAKSADDVEWREYNRTLEGERFSELDQINAGNAGDLAELCRIRVSGPGPFSTGLIEQDGVIYLTTRLSTVALSATNCDILWKSNYALQGHEVFNTHRGVAVGGGLVVRGTTDDHLVAYDQVTGQQRWVAKVGDSTNGEFVSSAPLIWHNMVFAGAAGGDWGMQGHMEAFDLATGRRVWSFNLIPGPGEKGNETWAGDSWKRGGGGTWTSYTLDPKTGELFVPVADPAMTWNGKGRAGSNLFTNSVVVLDAATGKYKWHYQTLPHDTHDYGVTSAPILATLRDGRQIVAVTPKDGYLYVIDRATHRLIYRAAATTILNHEVEPTPQGVRFCPGIYGGSEWSGPAFDPSAQMLITGQTDWCTTVKQDVPPPEYKRGFLFMGGTHTMDEKSGGWVTAFAAGTGKISWRKWVDAPLTSGVTPTAGGVTFLGDMSGKFHVLRTSNGETLKSFDTGGAVAGGVITYRISGRQYVAITSGNISRSSWPSAAGLPSVVIYALPRQDDTANSGDPGDPAHGKAVFNAVCTGCHGVEGKGGGGGPVLTGAYRKLGAAGVQAFIMKPSARMPQLYPSVISKMDAHDLAAYLGTLR